MNISILITSGIMVGFFITAFGWSIWRTVTAAPLWRLIHGANCLFMSVAAYAYFSNRPSLAMIAGLAILLSALTILLLDKSPGHWLAAVQLIGGSLLASGLPFAT